MNSPSLHNSPETCPCIDWFGKVPRLLLYSVYFHHNNYGHTTRGFKFVSADPGIRLYFAGSILPCFTLSGDVHFAAYNGHMLCEKGDRPSARRARRDHILALLLALVVVCALSYIKWGGSRVLVSPLHDHRANQNDHRCIAAVSV